jgi:hypothetical protein
MPVMPRLIYCGGHGRLLSASIFPFLNHFRVPGGYLARSFFAVSSIRVSSLPRHARFA